MAYPATTNTVNKFKEAFWMASVINANKVFKPPIGILEEEPWKDKQIINGRTLVISKIEMDIIDSSFSKTYVDMDILCLGPNLTAIRHFNTNPDKLASNQGARSKKGGLLGCGWVMAYESYCRYREDEITIINTDNTAECFKNRGNTWINLNKHSLCRVIKEDRLKNEIAVKTGAFIYTYRFDGRLKYICNGNSMGNELHYIGDSCLIEKIVSSCGKSLYFRYKDNKIEEITDHTGRTVKYKYDFDWLHSVEQANGGIWEFEYDKDHHKLMKITNPNNQLDFAVYYDKKAKPLVLNMQENLTWRIEHDDRNMLKDFYILQYPIDLAYYAARGLIDKPSKGWRRFSIQYNRTSLIQKMIWADDTEFIFSYDERGNLVRKESSRGEVTLFSYDTYNRTISETDPSGNWQQRQWNRDGLLSKYIKSNGYEQLYEYDTFGNLIEIKTKLNKGVTAVIQYEYDAKGRQIKYIDAIRNRISYHYKTDLSVLPETTVYPNGFEIEREYDHLSRLIMMKDYGVEMRFVYNYMDRPVQITRGGSQTEFRRYDYMGQLIELTLTEGVKKTDGGTLDSRNAKYHFIYNETSDLIYLVYPSGKREWMLPLEKKNLIESNIEDTCDFAGNLISRKTCSHKGEDLYCICSYQYDKNQNIVREKISDEATGYENMSASIVIDYEYDNRNNVSHIHVNSGMDYKFFYKGIDRLVKETRKINETTEHKILYEYNERGLLTSKIDLMDTDDSDMENLGIDDRSSSAISLRTTFTYGKNDTIAEIHIPNGSTIKINYDADGNIVPTEDTAFLLDTEIIGINKSRTGKRPVAYQLKKDHLSYVETLKKASMENGFVYDKFGRLIRRTHPDGSFETLAYDCADNIISKRDCYGQTTQYKYNSINCLKERINPDGTSTIFLYGLDGEISKEKQIL